MIKKCSKCGETKEITEFYQSKGEIRPECKLCTRVINRRYSLRKKSKGKIERTDDMREYLRDYYHANKEKYKEYRKKFLEKNPEYYREYYRRKKNGD